MIRVALILSLIFTINVSASINNNSKDLYGCPENDLAILFGTSLNSDCDNKDIDLCVIEVVEIEEEVEISFDTKAYLPKGFNPYKGMFDIDWNAIKLVEIEEGIEINFDTKAYLPKGFNPYKGMFDIDWNTVELVEIEEDIELGFDTKNYLPANFNPYKNMCENKVNS